LQVFGDLNTKTARALLRQFNTVSQVKQVRATTIAKIKINSKRGVGAKAAAKLKALVKKIDYLDPMEEAMSQRTRDLVAHLDILFVQLENLKQQIEVIANESQDIRQIAENVAGAGLVNASELMAEIGDISRFANRDKLTIYCGIGCLNHSSGKMVSAKKPTHMNHHAKNALCLMALAALRHDPESKTYYDKKRQEGKKHWHAIKCLAKYLLRKIFTLLNQNSQSCPLAQAA
jgi:transposase